MAGVSFGDISFPFAWHPWHWWHCAGSVALCHTPSLTHHLLHTTLSHTIFDTPHCHTPSLTRHLSHTTLSHTIYQTPSFTHNFDTHTHSIFHTQLCNATLSHTIFHTQLCHRQPCHTHNFDTHTIFHTPLCHTPSFTHHLSHTTFHT